MSLPPLIRSLSSRFILFFFFMRWIAFLWIAFYCWMHNILGNIWLYVAIKMHFSRDFNQPIFLFFFHCREIYPRVLECILQTELPDLMLNHKDEILDTLDTIANDTGKQARIIIVLSQCLIMENELSDDKGRRFSFCNSTLLHMRVGHEKNNK